MFALIPQASKWVDGVVELRGKVIPVIDLRAFFDLKSEGDQQKRTIVVDIRGKVMGINVDAVEGIIQKAKNEINLAPEAVSQQYIEGIIQDAENLIIMLNLDAMLSAGQVQNLQELVNSASARTA